MTANSDKLIETLWLQYIKVLTSQITGSGVPQVVSPYIVWDWGGKDTAGGLPFAQYQTLNQVPQDPVSDVSTYGTKPGFGQNYSTFLSFIDTTPGSQDKEYEQLLQALTDAGNDVTKAIGEALVQYKNEQKSTKMTTAYSEWLKNDGSGYNDNIVEAQGKQTAAQSEIDKFKSAQSGPVSNASKAYSAGLVAVQDLTNPLTSQNYPGWDLSQNPYAYVNQITGNAFGSEASKGAQKSFSISQASETYNYKETWGEAEGSFLADFFGIEASGSYDDVEISKLSDTYTITFEFQDLTTITVTPGAWYDPSIPGNYKNGPFFEGHSGFQPKSGDDVYYFGTGGLLARSITALIIGYRPTIIIDGGSSFTSDVKTKIDAGGSLIIGPFSIGGSGGSQTEKDTFDYSDGKITAKSNGDWPYIVAIVSDWVVDPPASSLSTKVVVEKPRATFRISGALIDSKTQCGLSGLIIEAWDKDFIYPDLVGSTITDGQGRFQIEFDESYFQEVFSDRRPDLFFKVLDKDELLRSTEDSILWNVSAGNTEIYIKVDAPL